MTADGSRRILGCMKTLAADAPAKINLTLRVGPRRTDGFHEVESLVARIALFDRLTISPRSDGRITLICDDPAIPADESNLASRAARMLAGRIAGRRVGAAIALTKRIPAGAGLGGGSSDAATTLMLLNELWNAGLSREELAGLGAALGSDVPLFFYSPVCVLGGRGELVRHLDSRLSGCVLLVTPGIHSSTPAVYRAFDEMRAAASGSSVREDQSPRAGRLPGADRLSIAEVLERADHCESLMGLLFNDLERPAFRVNPELGRLARDLSAIVRGPLRMTGSGSAFFRLFDRHADAEACAEQIRRSGVSEAVVTDFDAGD